MNPEKTIKNPISNEKAIRLMESENKLIFNIDKKATKADVKKAMEKVYNTKILSVNTQITKGQKRAYVKLSPDVSAIDLATKIGIM